MLMKLLIILIFNMISVGFYTLLEQKILSYMNNRLGPNKIFMLGMIQFLSDFLKLLFKDNIYLLIFNYINYYLFIYLFFILSIFLWIFYPLMINMINMKFMFILMMIFLINKILIFMLMIWSLNSIYSILSLIRLIIQNLSFEMLFLLILFYLIMLIKNLNFIFIFELFNISIILLMSIFIFFLWILVILIELNRLPFDFLESESELISGINLEFSSINFMIFFLIEYLDMIFMSLLSINLFFNMNLFYIKFYFMMMIILILLLLFRGFLVRLRIDKLMMILWKLFFPLLFNYLIFLIYFKM